MNKNTLYLNLTFNSPELIRNPAKLDKALAEFELECLVHFLKNYKFPERDLADLKAILQDEYKITI